MNNFLLAGHQFLSNHFIPKQANKESGLNPGPLAPQTIAVAARPWILGHSYKLKTKSLRPTSKRTQLTQSFDPKSSCLKTCLVFFSVGGEAGLRQPPSRHNQLLFQLSALPNGHLQEERQ